MPNVELSGCGTRFWGIRAMLVNWICEVSIRNCVALYRMLTTHTPPRSVLNSLSAAKHSIRPSTSWTFFSITMNRVRWIPRIILTLEPPLSILRFGTRRPKKAPSETLN